MILKNTLHENGRIYSELDEFGAPRGYTASPYDEDYDDAIEEDLKPLAYALMERGYLTCSSCAGHNYYDKIYMRLAVNTEKQMEDFKKYFNDFPFLQIVENIWVDELPEDLVVPSLNKIFRREYLEYVIFEMRIGYTLPVRGKPKKLSDIFKLCIKKLFKKHYLSKVTKRIKLLPFYDS